VRGLEVQMDSISNDYGNGTLANDIRSRIYRGINGLDVHFLEAGYSDENRPLVVLLHGFPELAYSWRKVIPSLAGAGYHVIAPDQRGFGRTLGGDHSYIQDLSSYSRVNLVRDILALVFALGYSSVDCIIGHDSGAGVAGWASLIRPDVFKSVILMSAPFSGPPEMNFGTHGDIAENMIQPDTISDDLALLPSPRKHYQDYYRTSHANDDMMNCVQGLHAFIRGYYHYKSADWKGNTPFPLKSWTPKELAKMPTYYIMDLHDDMAQVVDKEMASQEEILSCKWLTETELEVYVLEYGRTGFQGGLNWYRSGASTENRQQLEVFSGKKIDLPSLFIAGAQDWGPYQRPGSLERMQQDICTNMPRIEFVDNAGHWVQQEQPEKVADLVLGFMSGLA